MSDLKNTDGDKYRGALSVYACQSDTTHPVVLDLAVKTGKITKERYQELTNVPKALKLYWTIVNCVIYLKTTLVLRVGSLNSTNVNYKRIEEV